MTSAQVVETPVKVTPNSPSQDYTYLDDHNRPFYSCCCVTWLIAGSEAAGDLVLIQISLLFYANTG